jgi:hypothetical protein
MYAPSPTGGAGLAHDALGLVAGSGVGWASGRVDGGFLLRPCPHATSCFFHHGRVPLHPSGLRRRPCALGSWLSRRPCALGSRLSWLPRAADSASAAAILRDSLFARALGVLTSADDDAAPGVGVGLVRDFPRGFFTFADSSGAGSTAGAGSTDGADFPFLLTGSLASPGSSSIRCRAMAACAALARASVPVAIGTGAGGSCCGCCGAGGGPTVGPSCVTALAPAGGGPGGGGPPDDDDAGRAS